jgi:hypothetical protein
MTRDNNYSPFTGRHREPLVPTLVEVLWRVVGPSRSCGTPVIGQRTRKNSHNVYILGAGSAWMLACQRSRIS